MSDSIEPIMYGANIEKIPISVIRESNKLGKQFTGLVAVFVGGTGGIGENTAKEFFKQTKKPKAYIIGRNEASGNRVVNELQQINNAGEAIYLQQDISLLRNVDSLAAQLREREPVINCLFLTAGYMTLRGRNETDEGIDKKMCTNYYSRIRWILALMPSLQAASRKNELSRVISVLAAGSEGEVRLDDLDLRHNFTLHACLAHCVVMTDFAIEELARRYPQTAFSHSYPGTVKTGIANELTGPIKLAMKVLYAVMSPWILNVRESGERHFFQMTSLCYPAADGAHGIAVPEGMGTFRSMDGRVGGGAYLIDWDGKTTGDERVLRKYRELDMGKKVWDHTMQVFEQAENRSRRGSKRSASDEAEGAGRGSQDPIGWRPA